MPIFNYTGYDENSMIVKDRMKAQDESELKIRLKEVGVTLIESKKEKEKRQSNFFAVSSRVSRQEFITFCEEFAIMLNTGSDLSECLDVLRKQDFNIIFKNVISEVYERVLEGSLLSTALRKHKKIFPDYFCSMVYIGEISGNLASVLRKASDYYDNDQKIKAKVKSSMAYPIFLFIVVVAIFFLLMIYVVPMFSDMILQYGQEPPLLTQIVMAISDFFVNNLLYIVIFVIALVLALFIFFKTKIGKLVKEAILIKTPLIRKVKINSITTRFASSFATLIGSGMTVLKAMKEMPKIIGNEYFTKKFTFAIEEVSNGKKLSRALENCGFFPALFIQMVKVGEDNSALTESLDKVGTYYSHVFNNSLTRAVALLEPIVIVIMGVLVGIILLAVMLPIFQLTTAPLA